jgi:hypothetical protein
MKVGCLRGIDLEARDLPSPREPLFAWREFSREILAILRSVAAHRADYCLAKFIATAGRADTAGHPARFPSMGC